MCRILLTLVFVCVNSLTLQAQDTLHLSLQEAVDLSLSENRNIKISQLEVQRAESSLRESRGNLLPRVEASGNYNHNILRPVIFLPPGSPLGEVLRLGAAHSFNGTLAGSVPIYSGQIFPSIRLAETSLQVSRESLRESKVNTVGDVKVNYYSALLAHESLQVMEVTFRNAEENHQLIRRQYNEGIVSEYELIRSEVQMQSILPSVEQATDNMKLTLDRLKLSIGLSPLQPIVLTDSLMLRRLEEEPEIALEENPSVRTVRYQDVMADQQVTLAQSARHPTLSAFGNYQAQSQAEDFRFGDYNWVNTSIVGLQVSMPIFNGFMTNQRIEQARIGKLQLEHQKVLVEDAVRMQTENQIFLMRQAYSRYMAQQNSVQLAERGLRIAQTRYASGISTLVELNDAELALTQAKLNYLQAIYDYNIAYAEYERLSGTNN
ncbi:MAG: TolC family protein [Cytophagaceae bacterium]